MVEWPENMLRKPAYGQPCNNCGACCLVSRCPISVSLFGESSEICPAIVGTHYSDGMDRFHCGLVVNTREFLKDERWSEDALKEAFSIILGAGVGCDAAHDLRDLVLHAQNKDALRQRVMETIEAASPEARNFLDFIQGED